MQGFVEVMYNLFQALIYSSIVYFMVGFANDAGEDNNLSCHKLSIVFLIVLRPKDSHPAVITLKKTGCKGNRYHACSGFARRKLLLVCFLHVCHAPVLHDVWHHGCGCDAQPHDGCSPVVCLLLGLEPFCWLHNPQAGMPATHASVLLFPQSITLR